MWGLIPAAGLGSRIQPLAFSKELLPIGSRLDGDTERPARGQRVPDRADGEGRRHANRFVIAPGKSDILQYFGASVGRGARLLRGAAAARRPVRRGLPRRAVRRSADEPVLVGLPDTVWFPDDALARLPCDGLSFLLFPVDQPALFDAVAHSTRQAASREIQ